MRPERPAFDSLLNKHKGEIVLVLGNSSSLTELDLSLLTRFTTIGVNRILRVFKPTYLLVVDKSVVREEHQRMNAYAKEWNVLAYPPCVSGDLRPKFSGPHIFVPHMTSHAKPDSKRGDIYTGRIGNTGYEGTQMAFRMGARVIALAGIDLLWPLKKPSHFFADRPKGCHLRDPKIIAEDFLALKKLYATHNVTVVSVSPWKTELREYLGYVPLSELHAL